MPQVQTASYCASRVAQLVAVSRSCVRAYIRRKASWPACRLAGDRAKKTPMYSSGLVWGVPTAPMTSAAQPCMPAAPCGAADARISRRTMPGLVKATCCATKLPMENPRRSTWAKSIAAMKAIASCAICSTVSGVVPLEPPTPALSKVTTRLAAASASISAGSQLSRFPRKCWNSTSGTPPPAFGPVSRYA